MQPEASERPVPDAAPVQHRTRRQIGPIAIRVVSDFTLATVALAIVYFVRFDALSSLVPTNGTQLAGYYGVAAFPLAGCVILVFIFAGVYQDRHRSWFVDELFAVWGAVLVAGLVVLAITSLYRDQLSNYSRLTFGLWLVTASLLIGCGRYVIRRYERARLAQGIGSLRALVVGQGRPANLLIDRIRMFPHCGYRIVGSVVRSGQTAPPGVPLLGHVDDIRQIALDNEVDAVFIADSDATQQEIAQLAGIVADLPAELRIMPRAVDIIASSPATYELAGLPLLTLKRSLDRDPMQLMAKRAIDILLSGLGLICLSPVMMMLVGVIRITSPGPALIHQDRVGLRGRVFRMHKFRSMRVDAEVSSGPVWATPGDSRRTNVGRFIRRFSLDELPQLWNVLVGEMSLVGPRPERPFFVEQLTSQLPNYGERIRLRPGLTGWAQLNDRRGLTPIEERLIYDLYYLERWGITFDMKIILTTAFRVAAHKNAS
jgi:exopolysaccharide biosynthesis polyprenyl glycosylphosphotransferase